MAERIGESLLQQPLDAAEQWFDREAIEAQARQLIQSRDRLDAAPIWRQERQDNARTALMEALTASGHLSVIKISGSLEEINHQVISRLLNGWDDRLPKHEQHRRFLELCEELTIQNVHAAIVRGDLSPDTEVGIISDCPPQHKVGDGIGYRFANQKGMVRSTALRRNEDGTYTRTIEQMSRSNSGWRSTFGFLSAHGIEAAQRETPDLAALAKPFIYQRRDWLDGVVDVQRQLDRHAGGNVRYGDQKGANLNHVAYEAVRQESARREAEIEVYISGLADLEQQLAEQKVNGLTETEARAIFSEEIDRILSAICMLRPEYTRDTYGTQAEAMFYHASYLVARGDQQQALNLVNNGAHLKDAITFCGMTISLDQAKQMGLEVNSLGELVDKGKESWKWKRGVCQVSVCATRPGKTEVGPCNVCRCCQKEFDAGRDPTRHQPKSSSQAAG